MGRGDVTLAAAVTLITVGPAERTRIARDMHDVVTHSVGLMVVQAEAPRQGRWWCGPAGVAAIVARRPTRRRECPGPRRAPAMNERTGLMIGDFARRSRY